jgi:hypothetical protein
VPRRRQAPLYKRAWAFGLASLALSFYYRSRSGRERMHMRVQLCPPDQGKRVDFDMHWASRPTDCYELKSQGIVDPAAPVIRHRQSMQ